MAPRHILVRGTKSGLPYSKGLLANSLSASGLATATAYAIAEHLEERLLASGVDELDVEELREEVARLLREEVGAEASARYLNWQRARIRDRPLILMIGGATGVGKSTVATQTATQLGITRIVSTDAIREVMRSTLSPELVPHLHVSSFEALAAQETVPSSVATEALLVGFLRQVAAVRVGVEQIIARSVLEQTDTVIEGVHLVPDLLPRPDPASAITVACMLAIEDEDRHRSNFTERGQDQRRPHQRYLERFDAIRLIQRELLLRAEQAGVPVIRSFALDTTVDHVTTLVVDTVTRVRAASAPVSSPANGSTPGTDR